MSEDDDFYVLVYRRERIIALIAMLVSFVFMVAIVGGWLS